MKVIWYTRGLTKIADVIRGLVEPILYGLQPTQFSSEQLKYFSFYWVAKVYNPPSLAQIGIMNILHKESFL